MTISYFDELGRTIASRWQALNHDERAFPELTEQLLAEHPAHQHVEPNEVLRKTIEEPIQRQFVMKSIFGQPPITVYHDARFVIDVYFWFESSTSIHQHIFSGAFQVLSGSSLHARYSFRETHRINAHMLLGDVVSVSSEVLSIGDTRPILAGRAMAHSLFHFESPSTTVVVRTKIDVDVGPQYTYLPPFVAFDDSDDFSPRARTLAHEAMAAIYKIDPKVYEDSVLSRLERLDLEETFFTMIAHLNITEEAEELRSERFDRFAQVARTIHGEPIDRFIKCFAQLERTKHFNKLRQATHDVDHRFTLATLRVAQNRSQVLAFVAAKFPDKPPVKTLISLLRDLMATKWEGGNALGFEFGKDAFVLLELLLEGVAPEAMPARLIEMGYPRERIDRQCEDILMFRDYIRTFPALRILAE